MHFASLFFFAKPIVFGEKGGPRAYTLIDAPKCPFVFLIADLLQCAMCCNEAKNYTATVFLSADGASGTLLQCNSKKRAKLYRINNVTTIARVCAVILYIYIILLLLLLILHCYTATNRYNRWYCCRLLLQCNFFLIATHCNTATNTPYLRQKTHKKTPDL